MNTQRYTVYRVTSLADSGPGSLRDAVSDGCRLVSFDIAGTINLTRSMNIAHSYVTIDGSSAPAPGITIVQPHGVATTVEARRGVGPVHDVIINHLRMVGAGDRGRREGADIWGLDGERHPVHRIVLHHITAIGSQDGIFDLWGRVHDVTISWNLITGTQTATHMSPGSTVRERISIHHNLFAKNNERQIRVKYDSRVDFVNNIVYGWGWFECDGAGLEIDASHRVDPTINVVANVFHHVEGTPCGRPDDAIVYRRGSRAGTSKVYIAGNVVPPGEKDTASTTPLPMAIPRAAAVTTDSVTALGDSVVPCVGTHYPTADERTLLDQISRAVGGRGGLCGKRPLG